MKSTDADRNLLFGVIALQTDAITRTQFIDGCALWASQKQRPLAALLAERGWITPEDRADVERLVDRKLRRHDGDLHASLAELVGDVVRHSLAQIDDAEIRRSIAGTERHDGHVLVSTLDYTPETHERYTLARLHARGGIGQVWLARDADLGREVALKELRPEQANNPVVWSRFLEEAKITGQLEHPNIVPVHELVRAGEGRQPFYTMRFVKGRTLSEAIEAFHRCRAEGKFDPLEFPALLGAFLGVCNAVAYAHSRGVIHRDLKPQNVVLGDYGEVIVLDWGLAKLVERPEETLTPAVALAPDPDRGETVEGQVLGTPAYMSPEQAEGRWDSVDRRTDIYGLGAILYEILSGQPPFKGDGIAEVLRKLATESPAPPRSLCPPAPPPLEAVCLKALAKRPGDRYASARDLADEVRHYLADEPVTAYPEPALARLARWGRRHRTLVAAAALLLITAVAGLSVGTVLLSQANARTERQRQLAQTNFQQAEANFRKAREAVDEYFTKVSQSKLLNVPGLQPLRKDLLESARKYYDQFLRDRGTDRTVRAEAAQAWYRLGYIESEVGTEAEAAKDFQEAVAMYEALARDYPGEPNYPYKLSTALINLSNQQYMLGLDSDSLRTIQRSIEISRRVATDHPNVPEYRKGLGTGLMNCGYLLERAGRAAESMPLYNEARDLYERLVRDHPDVADYRAQLSGVFKNLAFLHEKSGRIDKAFKAAENSRGILEEVVRDHPENLDSRYNLAWTMHWIGTLHHNWTDRHAEAIPYYRRAIELLERLVRENPEVRTYPATLASTYCYLGQVLREAGHEPEASDLSRKALALFERIDKEGLAKPYDIACIRSLSSDLVKSTGKDPAAVERSRRLADQAMEALRQAVDGGYRDLAWISIDPDLDPLRSRDDYKVLIAEIKAKSALSKKPEQTAASP
jgi:eukaryotic-like serine/threonine-protein kinase